VVGIAPSPANVANDMPYLAESPHASSGRSVNCRRSAVVYNPVCRINGARHLADERASSQADDDASSRTPLERGSRPSSLPSWAPVAGMADVAWLSAMRCPWFLAAAGALRGWSPRAGTVKAHGRPVAMAA
jgi:hypothetical protein